MSKAFTKESDDEQAVVLPVRPSVPPGIKNYITPAGAESLRNELDSLLSRDNSPKRENEAFRQARVAQLQETLSTLVIAEPPTDRAAIRFGAVIRLRRGTEEEEYQLVGVDETDLDRNAISWLSPLAKALMGRRSGEKVWFRSPRGEEEITVLEVTYR